MNVNIRYRSLSGPFFDAVITHRNEDGTVDLEAQAGTGDGIPLTGIVMKPSAWECNGGECYEEKTDGLIKLVGGV